jgi:hypothetical protein
VVAETGLELETQDLLAFFLDTLLCATFAGLLPIGCGGPTLGAGQERRYVIRERKRPCRSPITLACPNLIGMERFR